VDIGTGDDVMGTYGVGDPPGGSRYVGGELLFVFTFLLPLPTDDNNIWAHR